MKFFRLVVRAILRFVRAMRGMSSLSWHRLKDQLAPAPRLFVRIVRIVAILSALSWAAWFGLRLGGLDQSQDVWTPGEVASASRSRLGAISAALDTVRDRLAADPAIQHFTVQHSTQELFALLRQRDSVYAAHLPDSALTVSTSEGYRVADHGSAIYSADGRLLAWYTSRSVTFGFDTLLTGEALLANRDRGIFLESEPIYAYLTAVRKLVSHEGVLEGYIETKRLIATKEPVGGPRDATFLGGLRDAPHREVQVHFGGVPGRLRSNAEWTRVDLFADPSDPASFVGNLEIANRVTNDQSDLSIWLNVLWRLGTTLVLIGCLIWLLVAIAEPTEPTPNDRSGIPRPDGMIEDRPVSARVWFSLIVIGSITLVRILVARLGGLSMLVGAAYRNPADFTSDYGYGIAHNPFELFVTSVFATAAAVMFWIVWMPREPLVRDESKQKYFASLGPRKIIGLIGFMSVAVFASQLLADGVSSTVEAIVMGGPLRYMTVKQVLPAPGMLLMLLSFLGLGVAFLFLTSLLLTFALRSAISLLSRRLSVLTRIIFGSLLLAVLMLGAVFAGDLISLSEISLLYRSSLAALAFIVSLSVITIDALSPDTAQGDSSFLYKLPRSSRSILFILAISTLIMSPLIASKQLEADKLVAERMVRENAEVSTTELAGASARILLAARDRLNDWRQSGRDTAALREYAFLIWLDGAKSHPAWEAAINVTSEAHPSAVISHFATLGAASEMRRIGPILDSEVRLTSARDSGSETTVRIVPCLTSSCAPVAAGVLRYSDTLGGPSQQNASHGTRLLVSVALWSDLPVLVKPASQLQVIASPAFGVRGGSSVVSDPMADGSFVIAEYRPNARRITNAPWLDVPSALPLWTVRALRHVTSFWRSIAFGGDRFQTLFYRVPMSDAIITVSTPEPTFSRTLEFALRLNAIGLIYGAFIVLVLLVARQVATRRIRFTLRFRDRIFLIVLLISLVPLVVVTNVTRTLLSERAQSEEQDRLARDASVIKDRIARVFEAPSSSESGTRNRDLQIEVENLSQIIGRDFSVFDPAGRLRASSRPELYESSLLASTLGSRAIEEVALGERTFFTEPVRLGRETYEVGYQPVTSTTGSKLLAVLSLATMNEAVRIDAQVARTTSFVYGIFAALGLVLLGIGALFAARVASPILELIHATERVARGKLQTSIPVTRDDEIGELMQSFNEMTHELEKSREIVAQTERELAWKEMARQVAHEIKNPLTPMKLSVQHLEHAHEAKDPNFNSIFRRVIRTLREQIDVLTRIATEFSRFGAMPRRKWGPVNLRRVCESAVALFDSERSRIRFIIDVPKNLPLLHSDEDELRRAFVNLLRNAVQAIEGWGIVVIRAAEAEGMIHVKLRDTGFGMSEETLKRAFDPNFSTKTSGMGLGLALVKKTITDMSGSIRVESEPGHGTVFHIDLPARGYIEESE
ncbi:MAG: ATP-binding protein [Bacteroidota bacterium]|nr:ATP-binding protein [Bacteroidota bacterium]MDP4234116.1 ATP-binding protein [Bacteroidota bacterium]MDP4243057.1 ATP-binding protein [Bacteroidota bacterium]MDP4287483.1 ATP-binding protein [Bacteroidota bacterium]